MKKPEVTLRSLILALPWLLVLLIVSGVFISFNTHTENQKQNITEILVGTWEDAEEGSSFRIQFSFDTLVIYTSQSDDYIELLRAEYASYHINDTIFVSTVEIKPLRFVIISLDTHSAIMCFYKQGKGIEDHISNLMVINKIKDRFGQNILSHEEISKKSISKDIYIFPESANGLYALCYNHSTGIMYYNDDFGNRHFDFTNENNGIIMLRTLPDIVKFLTGNIILLYKNQYGALKPYICNELNEDDSLPNNQSCALFVGFDRIARPVINRIVNDEVKGNILFIKIGKDSVYSINMLSEDSIYYEQYFHLLKINR